MKPILLIVLMTGVGVVVTGLTQLTPPATPTGLHAAIGHTQNAVLWNANTGEDLTAYHVYGGTSPNPTDLLAIVNAPATSYLHTGLDNGTTYYYRITAVNAMDNESPPTTDVTATPGVITRPTVTAVALVFGSVGSAMAVWLTGPSCL